MSSSSSSRGPKRKMSNNVSASEPPPRSSKATMLSPSLLLLEIPADTNTSLPVWEAVRSEQLDVAWTVNPYSIRVHLTPMTPKQSKSRASAGSTCSSPLSPSILQPQMLIQSIALQTAAPQTSSSVLLTFSKSNTHSLPSPPAKPQKTPPDPAPSTSFIASLPLIITQPQLRPAPGATNTVGVLPAVQAQTSIPTKLPPAVPEPSVFHTRFSSDAEICDNFLLGVCYAGKKCKMHHTPYPYHWQVWCVSTNQWIDLPPRSQVLLEMNYCNVDRELVTMTDGNVHNCLTFDTMELDHHSKYNAVRRLTNSELTLKNPYFPSKWKIYWFNNYTWEEYNENVSAHLLTKMTEKEPECSFFIGAQEYRVDFTSMTQTNLTSRFQREVRCRPVYRSPRSMEPYLRTVIHTDTSKPNGNPPAANFSVDPLEEFSSWYPPVWCPTLEQDYSLVDVPVGTKAYRSVENLFHKSLPETSINIISIQQIQNLLHWDKYQRQKMHMRKQHPKLKEPLERLLFHGTAKEISEEICHNNFDPRLAGLNGASHGHGSYFATMASLSDTYAVRSEPDGVGHMFLVKVLVGRVCLGKTHYRRPPAVSSKTKQYHLYDSCADCVDKPSMFVVFDSCQCYPYYLIKYKEVSQVIDIL